MRKSLREHEHFYNRYDDRQTTSDHIDSIISSRDDDKDSSFSTGFFPFDEDLKASRIYTGLDDSQEEVIEFDGESWVKDQLCSNEKFKKIVENGMSSDSLSNLPIEKLRVIIRGTRDVDVIDLIKGKNFAYCKFQGIAPSELIEIINQLDVEKLDLFLGYSFGVLNFIHYNKSIPIVDLFKLNSKFISLLLNNSFSLSKLIESNKGITLNHIVNSGYEAVKASITYFSHLRRNPNVSFDNFVKLYLLSGKEINNIFKMAKIYPNDNSTENPISRLKILALGDIQAANKKRDIKEVMPLYYISNAHNLLLCDVLFSDTTGLIDFIDRYPSVKRQERGMDYIIKLYEEQNSLNKGIKGNKTEVKGKFCGFLLFYAYEVPCILRQGFFSLDDMQSVCKTYPEYLRYILIDRDANQEWINKRNSFYEAIGLINGDDFFMSLKKEKPALLIFYIKFMETIQELIVNSVISISDIEDMYDVSINALDRLFQDKDAILRWNESKTEFYKEVDLQEGDQFFRDPSCKRIGLFMFAVKFKDEILYMHNEAVMTFQEMLYIHDRDPLVLQSILSNIYNVERLRLNENYRTPDQILSLFSTYGNDCLKQVDIINGGFSIVKKVLSKESLVERWIEVYRNNDDKKGINDNETRVSFNEVGRTVLFSIKGTPLDLMSHEAKDNSPKSTTALPDLTGCNNDTIVKKSDNFDASMKKALSSFLPYIKVGQDNRKQELSR
jgi:hypothetical protein